MFQLCNDQNTTHTPFKDMPLYINSSSAAVSSEVEKFNAHSVLCPWPKAVIFVCTLRWLFPVSHPYMQNRTKEKKSA